MTTTGAEAPPLALLIRNGLVIVLFLAILALSLRLLFVIGPLRPPPQPRYRGGTTTTNNTKPPTTTNASTNSNDSDPLAAYEIDDADTNANNAPQIPTLPTRPGHMLIVLGSGGHTAEMLAMLERLDAGTFVRSWGRRTWVVGEGDELSARRAREFEAGLVGRVRGGERGEGEGEGAGGGEGVRRRNVRVWDGEGEEEGGGGESGADTGTGTHTGTHALAPLPRARRIHQPLHSTPLTALYTLISALKLLQHNPPDMILTNGPATGAIVVLASVLLRVLGLADLHGLRTVYVESWARVRGLSLSGRLLVRLGLVDRFVVQWEGLLGKEGTGGRGEFRGVLV
ncbi:uncharacterized protein K452DRAFT_317978 [Aplosporella prunicola CBS 121167]|uniref:UDP-N-acetylglucosamine transferase subunit ALG14 n=1 Tax=Aplosporella prunicola CBS 121167 TaxID=1176127 RepID=A0A6A6BDP2_9PEZI|nr:uncharacterized protein K452DRAFT_317978 [Aplosporella prunicola CBS 121167]KAF2142299.1 hypothetical protein K452DRAFT_317978 [Aplosporella prunicola CBS 121167]